MKLAIGCDHGGYGAKQMLAEYLGELGHEIHDMGCQGESVDYVDYVLPVCEAVLRGVCQKGILVCGTGVGMSIAANKISGIRCALCQDTVTAKLTREHNDSNVLALGGRILGDEVLKAVAKIWLDTPFSGDERHARRIEKIGRLERQ